MVKCGSSNTVAQFHRDNFVSCSIEALQVIYSTFLLSSLAPMWLDDLFVLILPVDTP